MKLPIILFNIYIEMQMGTILLKRSKGKIWSLLNMKLLRKVKKFLLIFWLLLLTTVTLVLKLEILIFLNWLYPNAKLKVKIAILVLMNLIKFYKKYNTPTLLTQNSNKLTKNTNRPSANYKQNLEKLKLILKNWINKKQKH